MNRIYAITLVSMMVTFSSCNKDKAKPIQLEGYWKFESRTRLTLYNFGPQGTGDYDSDVDISKKQITFYPKGGDPPIERTYKRDDKTITLEHAGTGTYTMEIKELTSEKLVTHTVYTSGFAPEMYDTVYKR